MRTRLVLAALAFAVAPELSRAAIPAPHDKADVNVACYYCHTLAVRTGVSGSNFNAACLGCHNQPGHVFGTPWAASDEASPGVTGNQHNWSGPAASPEHGAIAFLGYKQFYDWAGGNLQCIVCHDVHTQAASSPDSIFTSIPRGLATSKSGATGVGGTGSMILTAPDGSAAQGFRLKIVSKGAGGGSFIISHDYGWNPSSWLNWSGGAWAAGSDIATGGKPFSDGADVDLDSAGVKVRWSAGYEVGDYWDFYIGYPFLRYTNTGDGICMGCHQERWMNHVRARGDDAAYRPNGVRKFSHPVGVGLNANGFNTDRAVTLDADGTPGSSTTDGDGLVQNKTNDLKLGSTGNVLCTTCHAAHNADSNSLTPDVR